MNAVKKVKSVAIIGAGNAGIAAAGHMKSKGFEVRLFELPQYKVTLDKLKKAGKIIVERPDVTTEATPDLYTTDIVEAVTGVDVIMFTINTMLLDKFTELVAPVVTEEQVIFFNGAAEMACVRFAKKAKEMGIQTDFNLSECCTLTYAARSFPEEGRAFIGLDVKELCFAAYPSWKTEKLLGVCRQLYECLKPSVNVWNTFLENTNTEVHPGPCLLNAGRIEYAGESFNLYEQGMTEHVLNIIAGIGKERIALGKALDLQVMDGIAARRERGYFTERTAELKTAFIDSDVYRLSKGPNNLNTRYITEDASMGLALYVSLGKALGVPVPISQSVVTLLGCLMGQNYLEEGLTLEKLGMSGFTKEQLKAAVS